MRVPQMYVAHFYVSNKLVAERLVREAELPERVRQAASWAHAVSERRYEIAPVFTPTK